MVHGVSLISANLAAVCLESFLYGLFFLLHGISTYLLVRQAQHKRAVTGTSFPSAIRTPIFIAAQIIFSTVTAHWILSVARLFDAFVTHEGETQPSDVYSNLSLTPEVAKSALLVATVATLDAILIYRLYVIWEYDKRIVVFPILTWIGLVICGAGVCWQFTKYTSKENVYNSPAGWWIVSNCASTFATNIYCSALISWQVWRTGLSGKTYGGERLKIMVAITMESAMLHTAWNAIFFIVYEVRSDLCFTAIDLWSPISGIAFMLVNMHVALGWAQSANRMRLSTTTTAFASWRSTLADRRSFSLHRPSFLQRPPSGPVQRPASVSLSVPRSASFQRRMSLLHDSFYQQVPYIRHQYEASPLSLGVIHVTRQSVNSELALEKGSNEGPEEPNYGQAI
ncbi:hypothetical protein WOLCODRAFT_96350 [Wolfiporia cocos MD-104 SS10]|uniref:Uncharacterized protein n=1 Tax=Wolfiporia cocos (strain MD-104) TaxID=742152 RepID=A0A2H3J709_WOLCO|nr:hypothetical protein WOLCODRAFT_96350 [Wolfiporia cocos MD-104 SS10]